MRAVSVSREATPTDQIGLAIAPLIRARLPARAREPVLFSPSLGSLNVSKNVSFVITEPSPSLYLSEYVDRHPTYILAFLIARPTTVQPVSFLVFCLLPFRPPV